MDVERRPVDVIDGGVRASAIQTDTCQACGGSAKDFRDQASKNEYRLSGMCQACQDSFFTYTARDFELHGPETTVTISVDMRRDGSATIEAFGMRHGSEFYDIGIWTVDKETRKRVAPLVIVKVKGWAAVHKFVLDDGVTDSRLVFEELREYLEQRHAS